MAYDHDSLVILIFFSIFSEYREFCETRLKAMEGVNF